MFQTLKKKISLYNMMMEEPESIQIFLNSKNADRYNNGTSDVDFYLKNLEVLSQYYIHLSVKHAVVPYSFYNININNNNLQIRLFNSTGYSETKTANISYGNHNINSLLTELRSQLSSTFTITFNSITNKITITNSTYDFAILLNSSCLELIGFSSLSDIYSSNKTLTSNTNVNLQSVQCICIRSNMQTNCISSGNQNNVSTLASIPIANQPYTTIAFINQTNHKVNLYNNNLNTINIKLVDQNGRIVDLNGLHWSMTLQLDILRFNED
jgi:hypothetical protein